MKETITRNPMEEIWKTSNDGFPFRIGECYADLIWKDSYIAEDSAKEPLFVTAPSISTIFTRYCVRPKWIVVDEFRMDLPNKHWIKLSVNNMVDFMFC